MATLTIYHYNSEGLYIGSSVLDDSLGDKSITGAWMIPWGATDIKPPNLPANKGAKFLNGVWELVEDFRGVVHYNKTTKEEVVIQTIGQVADFLTNKIPIEEPCKWDIQTNTWIIDQEAVDLNVLGELKLSARQTLTASDLTVLRCVEAGIILPVEWKNYRVQLRAIISGSSIVNLPIKPVYPAGT